MSRLVLVGVIVTMSLLVMVAAPIAAGLNDVMGVLPKFAIPMREVGDHFRRLRE